MGKGTKSGNGGATRGSPGTIKTFLSALDHAEPRPIETADRDEKKNYAQRLSSSIALLIANKLRETGQFPGVLPSADGTGQESKASSGAHGKLKKTDVRFGSRDTGLELLVSIKTLNYRDMSRKGGTVVLGRYTKNMVRNDHELRAEAMDHHERHPYAVLVALFFLPITACDDGESDKSSFAHAVMTFRARSGRQEPSDPAQKFEAMYIGLHEPEGERRGEVSYFDVLARPPRRGRPDSHEVARRGLASLDQVIWEIVKIYGIRNRRYIEWADESDTSVPQLDPTPSELSESDEGDHHP